MDKMCVLCVCFFFINQWLKIQFFVRFLSPGSAETDNLIASCIRNIRTKTH